MNIKTFYYPLGNGVLGAPRSRVQRRCPNLALLVPTAQHTTAHFSAPGLPALDPFTAHGF